MIQSAILMGAATCLSFLLLLWKCPKKLRTWLLRRKLVLDVVFTTITVLIALPSGLGPTTIIGLALADLFWTAGTFFMKKASDSGLNPALLLG